MKNVKKLVALLLAAALLLCLCACGEKKPDDPNRFDFDDYEVYYKGACIMYSESGDDAIVLKFDFTNNSKEAASYGWTIFDEAKQDGTILDSVYVITDLDTYAGVSDNYFIDAQPGETLEIGIAYKLNGTGEVTMTLSDLLDKNVYTVTADPATLERVENDYVTWD